MLFPGVQEMEKIARSKTIHLIGMYVEIDKMVIFVLQNKAFL